MKRFFAYLQIAVLLTSVLVVSGNGAAVPVTKFDIYPTDFNGNPIPNKVFTVSPAMPNGATTITSGATYARIIVSSTCSTAPNADPCFQKNVYYTINGGSCFNRLRIRFLTAYNWNYEPTVLFSELYDGNEGFQVSGGAYYNYSLLPRLSPNPCG